MHVYSQCAVDVFLSTAGGGGLGTGGVPRSCNALVYVHVGGCSLCISAARGAGSHLSLSLSLSDARSHSSGVGSKSCTVSQG